MRRQIDTKAYETLPGHKPTYLFEVYERLFDPFSERDIRLLELGVYKGGSLLAWRNYFPKGTITGLDINPVQIEDETGRIRIYQGSQEDTQTLDRIAREQAPDGFDIIIDDCSHIGTLTSSSYWHLFNQHLKAGGLYVIEDVCTAYLETWPDGGRYKPVKRARAAAGGHLAQAEEVQARFRSGVVSQAVRLLPGVSGFLSRSTRFMAFYRSIAYAKLGKKKSSHTYGMVGFAKQLVDLCFHGSEFQANHIQEIRLFRNMLVVVRATENA